MQGNKSGGEIMLPIEVFIVVVVALLALNYFIYKYARKKGANDFAELCFIAGLMGKTETFSHLNQYAKPNGVVFLGDSITQDFNVYEYFSGYNVYNRGIGGDTSKGVLSRLNESVFELKPKKVFLNIGTNDLELINDGVEAIALRIAEIINKIKSYDKNIEVYLISVYPVNSSIDKNTVGKRNNVDILALNEEIKHIKNCTYIDLFGKLLKEEKLNPDYSIEGLHMKQAGYEVIKKEILNFID